MALLALLSSVVAELQPKARGGHAALKTFLHQIATTKPPLNLATSMPPAALCAFVFALFERRWGASEHVSTLGGASATALSSDTAAAVAATTPDLLAPPLVDALAPVVDALLRFVRVQPLSAALVDALHFVAERTDKPYVRDQVFRFFFEWLRAHLDASEPDELARLLAPASEHEENAVTAAADDNDDDFDVPCEARCHDEGNLASSSLRMIEVGLTDVWSAIRKMCAKKLHGVLVALGMNNVRFSLYAHTNMVNYWG